MLFFYVGLVAIILGILGKFLIESYKLMITLMFGELSKIDLIIKVLELVDMTMVAQLVWVVALAGVSLFVTTGHFDNKDVKKPDWLDHVNTYNLKLKRSRVEDLPGWRPHLRKHSDCRHGGRHSLHLRTFRHRHLLCGAVDAGEGRDVTPGSSSRHDEGPGLI